MSDAEAADDHQRDSDEAYVDVAGNGLLDPIQPEDREEQDYHRADDRYLDQGHRDEVVELHAARQARPLVDPGAARAHRDEEEEVIGKDTAGIRQDHRRTVVVQALLQQHPQRDEGQAWITGSASAMTAANLLPLNFVDR